MTKETTTAITFDDYVTMYDYYDRPLNYTFTKKNEEGLFYAHLIDFNDEEDIFWLVKVTEERIKKAEAGLIDLRTLLTSPEESDASVEIVTDDGSTRSHTAEDASRLYADGLPEAGVLLLSSAEES